jgi:hypothetical protein
MTNDHTVDSAGETSEHGVVEERERETAGVWSCRDAGGCACGSLNGQGRQHPKTRVLCLSSSHSLATGKSTVVGDVPADE